MAGTTDSITVLHVDDDPDFADLTATFLERENDRFEVETAASASDALAKFELSSFDCIVSDHDMSGTNGIEFLKQVREEHPNFPFILYTGKGSEEVASEAISAGVTDYLQKGGGTSQYTVLANRIRNAVDKYNAQTELASREQRLNLFFEQSPLGVIEWDENFNFVRLNDAAERILGYSEDTLVGRSWEAIVPESEEDPVDDVVSDLLENAGGYRSVNENVRKDGERIVCEWHNRVVTDDSGDVVAIFSQFQDITEQKEREQKLQEEEEFIERSLNTLVDIFYFVDTDGDFQRWNSTLSELTGYSDEEIESMNALEFFEGEHREAIRHSINEILESGSHVTEAEITTADGRHVPHEFRGVRMTDDDGKPVGIIGIARDITERQKREREIETIQRRFEAVLENTPTPMFMKDDEGAYIFVNQAYRDLFDLRDEEIVGRTDHEIHPPAMAAEVQKNDQTVIERGEPIEAEESIVIDGDERIFLTTKAPIYDTGERSDPETPVAVFGVATDITDRTVREQQLEALNQVTQELMSANTQDEILEIGIETTRGLLGIDVNAIHLYDADAGGLVPMAATDATYDLIGEPPTFTGGDSIAWDVYQRGESRKIDDVHEDPDRYNPDTPVRSELHLPLGDYGILIAGSPSPETFDDEDVLLGEILASGLTRALEQVERTEQLRARETELTEQNDRLEEFASIVSHDLRNPLNVAEGRTELAATECESEHLEHVERAHERMRTLIEDLLTLAREGETVAEVEPVALTALVEGCWANVDTDAATLVTDADRTVWADRSRLKQLFENLMRNAIEHGGKDVTVTVGAMDGGFYIEDDGPGIPADEGEAVFEAGYSTSEDGTGFGLSIVKRIVEAHDWEIRVTDGHEGGARFEITGVEFAAE